MKSKSFFYRVLAVICLVAFLSSPVLAATKKTTKKKTSPKPQPKAASQPATSIPVGMDYAELVEKVLPSMVLIRTDKMTGSGFFVSNKGDILTNYHVIDGAREILVTPHSGKPFYALVKDSDKDYDMALLVPREARQTTFLKISATLPRQGEAIMAVGNPKGFEETVSNGIVSAFRANKAIVQFTAPVSPGSSGGALINARGEVVGMPTLAVTDGQNLNFAIAPSILNKFWESARQKKVTPVNQAPITNLRSDTGRGSDKFIFAGETMEAQYYLDPTSLSKKDNLTYQCWIKMFFLNGYSDLKGNPRASYVLMLTEIKPQHNTWRVLGRIYYDKNDQLLNQDNFADKSEIITPSSPIAKISEFLLKNDQKYSHTIEKDRYIYSCTDTDKCDFYIDSYSIIYSPNIKTIQFWYKYTVSNEYRKRMLAEKNTTEGLKKIIKKLSYLLCCVEINTAQDTYRTILLNYYSQKGDVLQSQDSPWGGNWAPITPLGEKLLYTALHIMRDHPELITIN